MKAKKRLEGKRTVQRSRSAQIRAVTETALAAALIAVSAMISIPFPVPFTLQLLGVYFALFYLGALRGTIAILIYVAIGALGLPVFSGFSGGVGRLFDATGGFILGFILLALVYLALDGLLPTTLGSRVASTGISLLAFYAFGSAWYAAVYTDGSLGGYLASTALTVLPFLLPDLVKIAIAAHLASRIKKALQK